jgi:hypothetical protein
MKRYEEAIEEFKKEIEETKRFLEKLPEIIAKSAEETIETVITAPIVAGTEHLKNFRIIAKESANIPRYVIEDLRDTPILAARFLAKSPEEARKDIRDYLTWKKKIRPLNAIDLLVDLLDAVLPG